MPLNKQTHIAALNDYLRTRFHSFRQSTNAFKEGCANAVLGVLKKTPDATLQEITLTTYTQLLEDRRFEGGEHMGGLTDVLRDLLKECLLEAVQSKDAATLSTLYPQIQTDIPSAAPLSGALLFLEELATNIRSKLKEQLLSGSPDLALFHMFCNIRLNRAEGLFHLRDVLIKLSDEAARPKEFTEQIVDAAIDRYNERLAREPKSIFFSKPQPLERVSAATTDAEVDHSSGSPSGTPLSRLSRASSQSSS